MFKLSDYRLVLPLFFIFLCSVLSCGGGSSTEPADLEVNKTVYDVTLYYPLSVGLWWKFSNNQNSDIYTLTVSAETVFNGFTCFEIMMTSSAGGEASYSYQYWTTEGLMDYGTKTYDGTQWCTLYREVVDLPNQSYTGYSWSSSGTATNSCTGSEAYSYTSSQTGVNNISTTAGSFSNCLLFADLPSFEGATVYLAEGVGPVFVAMGLANLELIDWGG